LSEADDSIIALWMAEAADLMTRVLTLIDMQMTHLMSYATHDESPGRDAVRRRREALVDIAEADTAAFACLRRAPSAQFPPGEDEL
ncbi:MAG: hypothetical protein J7M38_02770, partial [Armatimonadetes bacterium]|nr:hypothetical protein [Armatimonadota bacterium]